MNLLEPVGMTPGNRILSVQAIRISKIKPPVNDLELLKNI